MLTHRGLRSSGTSEGGERCLERNGPRTASRGPFEHSTPALDYREMLLTCHDNDKKHLAPSVHSN